MELIGGDNFAGGKEDTAVGGEEDVWDDNLMRELGEDARS